ncbi:MAG: tRNA (N6-isopentenyl adenosine(37)-C2)-methylthiotransferase MiaB [Spirochaetota bacterium]|nr:tRNA (N6-isopentenyl adenosine(37)-C2)-methylthiotransferase MiaB [Spirochaetota bacterium]
MKSKSFILENFGCQMNVADATELNQLLKADGYVESSDETADVVILNSCAVRGSAEERIYGRLRHYEALKKKKPFTLILMGCVAQKEGEKVLAKSPHVDMVVGTHQKSRLPELLKEHHHSIDDSQQDVSYANPDHSGQKVFSQLGDYEFTPPVPSLRYPFKADVTIIHGCNKYCTYCIVPYTRGIEMSQKSALIIENVKGLVDRGVTEISLLGQNVNSYGQDNGDITFAELLYELNKVDGLRRIRFLTSHPKDFTSELIDVIRDSEKVCKYIHLPLQSASDGVLEKMRREYSYEHYRNIISELRLKIPGIALSTDILVGFPYESEKDYIETLEAMKEIRFDTAYMFKYSIREGTESAGYPDIVDETEKIRRLQLIIATQREITKEQNEKDLGRVEELLLESRSKNNPGELLGKTDSNKPVVVALDETMIGGYVPVRLKALKGNTFQGELLPQAVTG